LLPVVVGLAVPTRSRPPARAVAAGPLTVAITGAGGFVGTAVTRRLVAGGFEVRVHGGPPGAYLSPPPPGVTYLLAEIDDLAALRHLVDGAQVVVHLAGPASVAASFTDPIGFARAHVGGTATLLEACRDRSPRRLVYVSSAEIYGQPPTNPVAEHTQYDPRSPYGVAKVAAEGLVRSLAPSLGLEAVILRPFSIYGPGSPPHSLVARLARQVAAEPSVVVADLRPVRDYCYVSDFAEAVLAAARYRMATSLEVLNVGSGAGVSVSDLAELAVRIGGRQIPVREAAAGDRPRHASPTTLVADTRLTQRALGWRVTTPLAKGLARTIEWSLRGHDSCG